MFTTTMGRFPKCQPVIPRLRREDVQVEKEMEKLQAEAQEYAEGHRQLASIRYYLHVMLWECEKLWNRDWARGITNYKTLLDLIERQRKPGEEVCLVTFNYDRMLEDAMPAVGVNIRGLGDYVTSSYKLIKLHGSVNWGREVNIQLANPSHRNAWEIARELIDRVSDVDITERYHIAKSYPVGYQDGMILFPAIAIPVESKGDYECPQEHVEVLKGFLPMTTKIIVVGWRGMELPFRQLLGQYVSERVRVIVVSGSSEAAEQPIEMLEETGIKLDSVGFGGGFSGLVVSSKLESFLRP
jgi:hypothetical protein